MSTTKKVRLGVVGLGAIGSVHADAYMAHGQACEIVAVCDVMEERVKVHGDRLNVKHRFTNYRDLIKSDVDAISVCVGNTLHRDVAVAALKAGKHVLLEKPMAMNAKEAQEIVAAARKSGTILQIGMVRRQAGDAQLARKYVADGLLGEIYHLRAVLIRNRGIPGLGGWFTTQAMSGGGPLIDLGVHWFDAAMFVSGLWKPTSVSAACYDKLGKDMRNYKYVGMWAGPPKLDGTFDVEDYATGLVRFGTLATLSFEIAWAANSEDASYLEIIGDKGGVRIFDGKPMTLRTEFHGGLADIQPRFADPGNAFHIQARTFISACRGDCPPAATGEQGVITMKLIDAVYQSSKLGKEVEIK